MSNIKNSLNLAINGGKGSGNFGHSGRPGVVGGSGNGKDHSGKADEGKGGKGGSESGDAKGSGNAKTLDEAYKAICPGGKGSHPDNILDGTEVKEDIDALKSAEDQLRLAEADWKKAKAGDKKAQDALHEPGGGANIGSELSEALGNIADYWSSDVYEDIGEFGSSKAEKAASDISRIAESLIDRAEKLQSEIRKSDK